MNSKLANKLSKLPEGLAEKNVESWNKVVVFFQEFALKEDWKFLESMRKLVQGFAKSEQAQLFRAGQSIYHLLISTAEKHGLEANEPFVWVQLEKNQSWLIHYCEGRLNAPVESQTCDSDDKVADSLQPFLDKLWLATRE